MSQREFITPDDYVMVEQAAPSYDAFYEREYPRMVALAVAVSGSRLASEDLAQEAMIRAHRHWSRISTYEKPGAWLRRITINLSTSWLRRRQAESRAKARVLLGRRQILTVPEPDDVVWSAVADLPDQQRAAVALFYLEDRSVADIASILGCAEGTAKTHLHRGRQTLSDRLRGLKEES